LERKAALYEHLQRSGGGDDAAASADEARYNVDFALKARAPRTAVRAAHSCCGRV
jgi:hypothetical protein